LGPEIGNGGYLIFLFGLATILLTYYIARDLFDRRVAVVACALLAVASQFRFYAKVIGADGAVSAFFCLAALVLLFAALRNPRSSLWIWAVLGQTLGFALTVRPDNVLLLLPAVVLLILHLRSQNRAGVKVTIFASGILLWGMLILLANFLYTGDWFRTGYAVNYSAQHDRLGGLVSWRYFLVPSFRESNFVKLLPDAPFQWSLFGAEVDLVQRYFYYAADAFLLIGLIQVVRASKKEMEKCDLLIWSSLWFVSLVLFFSCYFGPTDPRYLQRVVPYLCLFTAVGLVTCWDLASRLTASRGALLVWPLRVLLMVSLGGAGAHLLFHPHVAPFARVPQAAYLRHVGDLIQEKDAAMILTIREKSSIMLTAQQKNAMILTDWSLPWMEYFFARDSQRTIIPLQRFNSCADSYVQWKRPPHPEWITEDCTNRDNAGSVRYRRMYENGAQDIYPYTVRTNQEVIDAALQSGRSVYLVTTGGWTVGDYLAMIRLIYRYNLELVDSGWVPNYKTPKEVSDITKNYAVAKVSAKKNLGIRILNGPDGHISFSGEDGFVYTPRVRLESVSEDRTQFKIVCDGESHDELILRFEDGVVQFETTP
jgi:4-amino-4-deoxy-L-arabinose transferase-like glycosyltransferase